MFTIAICDDNRTDKKIIETIVKNYLDKIFMPFKIDIFQSGEELLESSDRYDLVFLDIAMGGINGIQAGRKLRMLNRNAKIIYITNLNHYYKQAVNSVHAFAYLEKPITKERIEYQLDEIVQYMQEENIHTEMVKFEILEITKDGRLETKIKKFVVKDIFYFEYINRKIKIKLENEEYFFTDKMRDLAEKMKDFNFVICHQSFLVNLMHIKKIKGYNVFLENNEMLPVSQKKSADFRKKLNQFIQSNI